MDAVVNDLIIEPPCEPNIPVIEVQNELHQLICCRFGFDEAVYQRVVNHDFDIESLLVATDSELIELFPAPQLGTRAKFRFHLNLWRKDASTVSVSSSCREWIETHWTAPSPEPEPNAPTSSSLENKSNVLTREKLLVLLNSSETGVEVLKYYEEHKVLDEANKDILTSLIVDTYSNNRKLMTIRDLVTATDVIHSVFPKECKVRQSFSF